MLMKNNAVHYALYRTHTKEPSFLFFLSKDRLHSHHKQISEMMRRLDLLIVIVLACFSVSCYQKDIVPPGQINQRRPVQKSPVQQLPAQQSLKGESGAVTDDTNVHYNGKYCMVCHEQTPQKGIKFLKYEEDYKQLCRCHYKTAKRDAHPSDVEAPEIFKQRMPNTFPLRNGKIACITCHDVFAQCRDGRPKGVFKSGRNFLREGPYRNQTTFCFKCHDKTKYEKFNPHKQLDKNGKIITRKCLYCHKKVPDVKTEEFKDVALIGDLGPLCTRCHNKTDKTTLHSQHLRKPSEKVLARMKQTEIELGIVLPLNYDGTITCATCHNPHEKGVIPSERAGAKGTGMKHRLRISGNICTKCHEM